MTTYLFLDPRIVVISNDTSLATSETAVLVCVSDADSSLSTTWTHNGETVTNTSLITVYEEETNQGGRVFRLTFLQLCSVEVEDSGAYTCVVSNSQTSADSSVQLTVSGQQFTLLV